MPETDPNTIFILPRNVFDSAIIGYKKESGQLIYDFVRLVQGYIKLGYTPEDAEDYVCHNIIGAQINKYFPYIEDTGEHDA
jgi:hypothetical protein